MFLFEKQKPNLESTIHFIGNTMHWFAMVGEDAIDSPTETELSIEDLVNLGIKSSVA